MITDYIKNILTYKTLSKNLALGIDFIVNSNLKELSAGKYEIDGENVFVIISDYETKSILDANWEAHQKYIDIQYVITGKESIGFAPLEDLKIFKAYDEEKDFALFKGKGIYLSANETNFFIFYPQDGHAPGIELDGSSVVKKLVIKVKL